MKSSGEKKIAMFFEQIKKDIFPEWDKKMNGVLEILKIIKVIQNIEILII